MTGVTCNLGVTIATAKYDLYYRQEQTDAMKRSWKGTGQSEQGGLICNIGPPGFPHTPPPLLDQGRPEPLKAPHTTITAFTTP